MPHRVAEAFQGWILSALMSGSCMAAGLLDVFNRIEPWYGHILFLIGAVGGLLTAMNQLHQWRNRNKDAAS